jgi:transcriptional regulator with XRE-family HTH domain
LGKASITNLLPEGRDQTIRRRLGNEIRRRRLAAHMSQEDVSAPLTRGYVSQVERGQTMPSLPALIVIAEHLGTSADVVLRAVNPALSEEYAVGHEDD